MQTVSIVGGIGPDEEYAITGAIVRVVNSDRSQNNVTVTQIEAPAAQDNTSMLRAGRVEFAVLRDDQVAPFNGELHAVMALHEGFTLATRADVPADLVSKVAGSIIDNFGAFTALHPLLSSLSIDDLGRASGASFHEGAIAAFNAANLAYGAPGVPPSPDSPDAIYFVFDADTEFADFFDASGYVRVGTDPDPSAFEAWAAASGMTAGSNAVSMAQTEQGTALYTGVFDVIATTDRASALEIGARSDAFVVRDGNGDRVSPLAPDGDGIVGTDVSDRFVEADGDRLIDGAGGDDESVYTGNRSAYSVVLRDDGIVTVAKPDGSTDTLISIERVGFGDGALVFDIESGNVAAAYRLYGGAFDRTPDEGGLRFWIDAVDAGLSLRDAAASFLASSEFTDLYGTALDDAAFVDAIYRNVLDRPGEDAGVDFWTAYLAEGGDRAQVLVQFTQLPEYVGLSATDIEDGYWVF